MSYKLRSVRWLSWLVVLALLVGALPAPQAAIAALPTDLFFSEYIEGSSNNKALEIYNGTGAAIDLEAGAYNIQQFSNGSATAGLTVNLTGAVADGDVFVFAHSSANAAILAQADQTSGAGLFNGDDALVLRKGTTVIDAIGQVGFDPGTEWGTGLTSTADNTLRRNAAICAGDPNAADAFDPSLEWEGFATDTFGGLGSHTANCTPEDAAPTVTSSYPLDGATNFPVGADLTVTFSEPVIVTDPWFTLTCSTSGSPAATVTGGPATYTIDPAVDLVDGESCTLTIDADKVSDLDGNDPPDTLVMDFTVGFSANDFCVEPYTPIPAIQGSGATVALTGSQTTQGVVVADFEGPSPALRGFFIQDPDGDGDPATSDGIFVFEGSNADTVSLGDVVRVTGNAGENQGQSQISVGTIIKCGTDTVTPTDVTFPVASADYLERYEGMLVTLPQTMYVTEHFQLGRFGQVVLSSGARLQQPTNVVAPGPDAIALQLANNLNKIILDDASQTQNPDPIVFARGGQPLSAENTLRGGDTATGIVGVLNYTWAGNSASGNAYRIRPVQALDGYFNFEATNPRPTLAPEVGGTLRVAAMNTLNYFNTFDGYPDSADNCTLGVNGGPTDCRGADTQAEFDRQWPKTVAAIVALNPDVLGVNEIENDGYGPNSAIATLVDQLNTATAPGTYDFIDADTATGQIDVLGTDAIKVGMIYKPSVVTPIGQTAALNSEAFVNGGDGAPRSRPSLAQAFQENATGAEFIVDVNHLKSKGSACNTPDAGDGQGNCNEVRVNAATELVNWLAADPTGTGVSHILIMGDLNSYAMEDPVTVIKNAGYTNLIAQFLGPDAYSYVFDGQWGYLDHALGSPSIVAEVTGVGDFHINADEPSVLDYNTDFKTANLIDSLYAPDMFRVSDHDPVLVGLDINVAPTVSAGGPYIVDEGSSVMLTATGTDKNGDTLTYAWDLDNDGVFETPGQQANFAAVDGPAVVTVKVQATDPDGLTAVAETTVTINNVAPLVSPVSITPSPALLNKPVTASANFGDPGGSADIPFTCTVDYGDGSGALVGTVVDWTCTGPAHTYTAIGAYTITIVVTDNDGGSGSSVLQHAVIYDFEGFFSPAANLPAFNVVNAGSTFPIKWSLNGNMGLNVIAAGYPQSAPIACGSSEMLTSGLPTRSSSSSALQYFPWADQYQHNWKTEKSWSGTCRQFILLLVDGTYHRLNVQFR